MSNPVMNRISEAERVLEGQPMTVSGTLNKTLMMFVFLIASASYTWYLMANGFSDKASMLCYGGAIVGFVLAMIIIFSRKAMPVLVLAYAIAEGFFVGGISAIFEAAYTGIVFQAVTGTFAALFSMLLLYKLNLIRATQKFKSVVFISTMSIGVIYLIQIVASLFGRGIPQIFTSSNLGIFFSVFVVAIAALNLIIDFDFIEQGAANFIQKKYEWYGAFGLIVTLVWLYLEILRLLSKLKDR